MKVESLFEELEVGGGNVGEDGGNDAFELDDDMPVFVDSLDDAFDACELAFGDEDATAGLVRYVGIVEQLDAVVGDGGDADEVLHLTFGNMDDFGPDCWVEGTCHHVAQRTEIFVGHLEAGELFARGMDKYQVVDGGHWLVVAMPVAFHELVFDGQEVLDALLVKACLYFQLAVVGDAHGIPEGLGAEIAHR